MSTTTHPVAREEVMAFLDGELASTDAQAVSAHLELCKECTQLATDLRSTSAELRAWTVAAPAPSLESSVREAARGNPASARKSSLGKAALLWPFSVPARWKLGAIAAAVLIAVGIFGGMPARKTLQPSYYIPSASTADDGAQKMAPGEISRYITKLRSAGVIGGAGGGDQVSLNGTPPPSPMIARTVSLTLVVQDFSASRASLEVILSRHHSYAAELTASTAEYSPRSIEASLRVPASELASVMGELKSLGRVEKETQGGEEVTEQHADLVARLKNSRETELRLEAILTQRTGKLNDVLEVEQVMARVRGEIEQMEAEQKTLAHRVEFATVNLNLTEEYKAQLLVPEMSVWTRLHNALVAGYRNASESLVGTVVWFAEYGPALLIWIVLLGLPVVLLWRRYHRTLATL